MACLVTVGLFVGCVGAISCTTNGADGEPLPGSGRSDLPPRQVIDSLAADSPTLSEDGAGQDVGTVGKPRSLEPGSVLWELPIEEPGNIPPTILSTGQIAFADSAGIVRFFDGGRGPATISLILNTTY